MKKFILYSILFAVSANMAKAQGFRIELKTPQLPVDSLFISKYNYGKKNFKPVYAVKYSERAVFTDGKFLQPALYLIYADTNVLAEFLISDIDNQRFTIEIGNNSVVYYGNEENNANLQYQQKIKEFDQQATLLNLAYQKMSAMEKQVKMDSIILEHQAITRQKQAYQTQIAEKYKGSLLASIILSVMEVPPAPLEYLKDKTLYYRYLAEFCFYKYDFSDNRILATPLADNKFRQFSEIIAELDAEEAIPYVIDALRKSQVSFQQYSDLFDYLEHNFGDIKSPYRKEALYIAMLRYALADAYTDEYRKTRYRHELSLINKNHAGDKLPDFNLIMQNGDTTNLYNIKAERLLVFLQNPSCPTCKKVREKLKEMKNALSKQQITVLTVYFEEDKSLWQKYLQNDAFPDWLHGWNYDLTIEGENRIDIRSIPTLYLLDKNKIILKKDIDIHELELIIDN